MYPRFIINNSQNCDDLWKEIRFLRVDNAKKVMKIMSGELEAQAEIDEYHVNLFIEQGIWKEIKEEEAALLI